MYLLELEPSFFLNICPGVRWQDHMVALFLVFKGTSIHPTVLHSGSPIDTPPFSPHPLQRFLCVDFSMIPEPVHPRCAGIQWRELEDVHHRHGAGPSWLLQGLLWMSRCLRGLPGDQGLQGFLSFHRRLVVGCILDIKARAAPASSTCLLGNSGGLWGTFELKWEWVDWGGWHRHGLASDLAGASRGTVLEEQTRACREGLSHQSCLTADSHRLVEKQNWAPKHLTPQLREITLIMAIFQHAESACSITKSCPTLCDSMHCSPPGSSVRGNSQARILEGVAIFLLQEWRVWRSEVKSLSHVRLFATPWTVARQAPLSMGFSKQEYWSGLPFPSPNQEYNEP